MIQSFGDIATEHVFYEEDTKRARTIPSTLWPAVRRKLHYVHAATALHDLRVPPGNRLEALKGDHRGYHAIRINDQWRIVFRWQRDGVDAVEVTDDH